MGNFSISYSGLGAFGGLVHRLRWRAAMRYAFDAHQAGERPWWKTVLGGLTPQHFFEAVRGKLYHQPSSDIPLISRTFQQGQHALLNPPRPPQRTRVAFLRRSRETAPVWAADPLPEWDVEMRDPISDRRLVEALISFPLEAFELRGRTRGLAREIASGLLPDTIRLRRNQGQQAPIMPPV